MADLQIPPHDLQAERAVLGAILKEGRPALDRVRDLTSDDFFTDANREIFTTLLDLEQRDDAIESLTVKDALRRSGHLEFVGGDLYLAYLEEDAAILERVKHYVRIVRAHADRRRRIQLGMQIVTANFNDAEDHATNDRLLAQLDGLTDSGWPEPVPLSRYHAPDFLLDVFPPWLRDAADAVAASTQTPRVLAGGLALSTLSAAAAGRMVVELKTGWTEPVNVYFLGVLHSGEGKSPAFRALVKPLRDLEAALESETRADRARAAERRRIAEERVLHLRRAAAKAADAVERMDLEGQAQDAAADLDATPTPVRPRLLADNASPEKFEAMLATHRRLAILDDEGVVFSVMAGRYSKGANYEVFLKAYDAAPIQIDRMGREQHTESTWGAPLTMGLTVQPHVLREVAKIPGFADRGGLARFVIVIPNSLVGTRDADTPDLPADVMEHYSATLTTMLRVPLPAEPAVLKLAPLSRTQLFAFKGRIEKRLRRDGGDLAHLVDWGSKLIGRVARIAGLLHAAKHALDAGRGLDQRIAGDTMAQAIRLAENVLIPHAKIAYAEMGADPAVAKAERVLTIIHQKRKGWITRREVYTECRIAAKDADAPLELLVDHNYLRPVEPDDAGTKRGPGRRPTPRYRVNPGVLGGNIAESAGIAAASANPNGASNGLVEPARALVRL